MAGLKTYPLLLHFSTHITPDPGDPLLNAWILAWDYHALMTDPRNFFNANIFYPAEHVLAFSEHWLRLVAHLRRGRESSIRLPTPPRYKGA